MAAFRGIYFHGGFYILPLVMNSGALCCLLRVCRPETPGGSAPGLSLMSPGLRRALKTRSEHQYEFLSPARVCRARFAPTSNQRIGGTWGLGYELV